MNMRINNRALVLLGGIGILIPLMMAIAVVYDQQWAQLILAAFGGGWVVRELMTMRTPLLYATKLHRGDTKLMLAFISSKLMLHSPVGYKGEYVIAFWKFSVMIAALLYGLAGLFFLCGIAALLAGIKHLCCYFVIKRWEHLDVDTRISIVREAQADPDLQPLMSIEGLPLA